MSASRKAVCEFYFHLARHTRATPAQCQRLLRYAATLQRLAEADCNGYALYADHEDAEAKRARIQAKVAELCAEICDAALYVPTAHTVIINENPDACRDCGARGDELNRMTCSKYSRVGAVLPVFSGDPRGAVLKIRVPDGFSDDFGQEGICVPA